MAKFTEKQMIGLPLLARGLGPQSVAKAADCAVNGVKSWFKNKKFVAELERLKAIEKCKMLDQPIPPELLPKGVDQAAQPVSPLPSINDVNPVIPLPFDINSINKIEDLESLALKYYALILHQGVSTMEVTSVGKAVADKILTQTGKLTSKPPVQAAEVIEFSIEDVPDKPYLNMVDRAPKIDVIDPALLSGLKELQDETDTGFATVSSRDTPQYAIGGG